jgi:adenosylcobinamide-phosphate synthase
MNSRDFPPRPLAVAAGLVLDQLFDEPPSSLHPVVHFGRAMNDFEARNYRDSVAPGVTHAAVGVGLGALAGRALRSTTLATGLSVGGRALWVAAHDVESALTTGDIEEARRRLPTLVGRDSSELDESEIARAVVESVAENTVDAIVAPALWAAVAGAPGALGYRAINTMDAMVGHHSARYENYGAASARLDDAANWVPARVTAALVALVRAKSASEIRRAIAVQAPLHPSPNAGVAEAAFAAALGVQLGGRNRYGDRIEERATLGFGRPTESRDIKESIRLSRDVTYSLASLLGVVGLAMWWRRR